MRIACLHVPQFALQCVTRTDAALRGAPIVVVGTDVARATHGPVVQACSRAAWGLGARVGMTATAARSLAPELVVVSGDPTRERETVRAIADVLLGVTPVVDVGGRHGASMALYMEVPAKTRGSAFGDRVLDKLEQLGLTARVGIADDRFTAWVAASSGSPADRARDEDRSVISVPRGGSAAFLAPRPLSLLAISPEVQHMLEALGVTTLGEFAALPAPSVARPIEADYQALARGDSGHALRPYAPEAPIREEVAGGLAAMIALVAERIALRLEGRGRAAARLEVVASGPSGERTIPITPLTPSKSLEALLEPARSKLLASPEAIADALTTALSNVTDVWRVRVTVIGEALASMDTGEDLAAAEPASAPAIVDTLSLVLSNAGGSLDLAFGPISTLPRGPERRIARVRRGKQRPRTNSLIQPKLFKL